VTAPLDVDGLAAPPRSNGELVFEEPWESRAFAIAVALCEAGAFTWSQFQSALIARIARAVDATYYQQWLAALQDVLASCGAVSTDDITSRARALAEGPTGHGHEH
jgi:nitrile hydratase accessory protein